MKLGFTNNQLKIIAMIAMLIDHIGAYLFPQVRWLRIIGRLAYPIFAYMIAEGCRYTRHKLRYFLMVFGLGTACQLVYYFASGDTYLNILLTFSCSILLIYLLQAAGQAQNWKQQFWRSAIFAAGIFLALGMTQILSIDYGFWGIMTPVFAAFSLGKGKTGSKLPVLMMFVSLKV
jgi:hypothetical protein